MRVRDVARGVLVVLGLVLVVGAVQALVTLPPPPPSGRDIPGGFAIIFPSLAVIAGVFLAVAVPGVAALLALPVVLGGVCWRAGEVALGAGRRLTDG